MIRIFTTLEKQEIRRGVQEVFDEAAEILEHWELGVWDCLLIGTRAGLLWGDARRLREQCTLVQVLIVGNEGGADSGERKKVERTMHAGSGTSNVGSWVCVNAS